MKPIWFKRKKYGYGWYPATWQGWLILVAWIVIFIWNSWRVDRAAFVSSEAQLAFVFQAFLLAAILVVVCFLTGETPRWQWGDKDEEKKP